jgi:uncharacterized protein (DUF1015 family)
VVASDLQDHLYNLSPFNFLRLELNKSEPSDDNSNNVYTRAARVFRTWRNEGILQTEPDPAIYVYHQEFDYRGHTFVRKGFMACVRLKRFGEGNIYPHEETHAKAKDDRLKLTRATQANLSQVFGLYPDPENDVQAILESEISGVHGLEATDHLGVVHKVWPITDINVIAQVSGMISAKDMFIADGHHLYETACNYRDELAAKGELPSDHPANFVLTMLVGMNEPGLLVLPTHRLLDGIPELTTAELHEKLSLYFDCDLVAKGAESAGSVWAELERLDEQQIMALYSKASNEWTRLTCKPEAMKRMEMLAPNQSEDWRGLGVAILHKLILDDLLGLKGHSVPTYVHLVQEVIDGLNGKLQSQSGYSLAALVMPASIDNIHDVSIHQERMPAKSTYFFPKLVSGLVVHSLT